MANGLDGLTDREREVLHLLLAGHTAKSIAAELDLSVHTVNDYLRDARKKLGVSSSREAARILGEQESCAPQKLAPEQIGMEEAAAIENNPKSPNEAGEKSRLPWIIGGFVMIATAIAAAMVFASAGTVEHGEPEMEESFEEFAATEEAALGWAQLIDAGEYEESWAQAGPTFRSAVTSEAWATQVAAVREPLGKTLGRTVKSVDERADLPGAPRGDYRIVTFETHYEASPDSVETLVFSKDAGRWAVVGYFIR